MGASPFLFFIRKKGALLIQFREDERQRKGRDLLDLTEKETERDHLTLS